MQAKPHPALAVATNDTCVVTEITYKDGAVGTMTGCAAPARQPLPLHFHNVAGQLHPRLIVPPGLPADQSRICDLHANKITNNRKKVALVPVTSKATSAVAATPTSPVNKRRMASTAHNSKTLQAGVPTPAKVNKGEARMRYIPSIPLRSLSNEAKVVLSRGGGVEPKDAMRPQMQVMV